MASTIHPTCAAERGWKGESLLGCCWLGKRAVQPLSPGEKSLLKPRTEWGCGQSEPPWREDRPDIALFGFIRDLPMVVKLGQGRGAPSEGKGGV